MAVNIGAAVTSGITSAADPVNRANRLKAQEFSANSDIRQKQVRTDARVAQAKANEELMQLQAQSNISVDDRTSQMQSQMDVQNQALQQQRSAQTSQTFNGSFGRYDTDGNVKHLNSMLSDATKYKLPKGPLKDVVRMDNITSADNDSLQKQFGISFDQIKDNPTIMKDIVRFTKTDGTTGVGSIADLKVMTDYDKYATNEAAAETRQALELRLLYKQGTIIPGGVNGKRPLSDTEHLNNALDSSDKYTKIAAQEATTAEGYEQGGFTDPELQRKVLERAKVLRVEGERTSKEKQLDASDKTRADIDNIVKDKLGEEFWDVDFQKLRTDDPKTFERVSSEINRLEKLAGVGLDSVYDKKQVRSIRQLLSLGQNVTGALGEDGSLSGGITKEETGIIDNITSRVGKYISDDVDGVAGRASFSAYRNMLRNSLYGATLTPNEMRAFDDQFGNLGEQAGPVAAQFKVALEQLKSDIQTVNDLGDPRITHFRLGVPQEDIEDMLSAIDENISYLNTKIDSGGGVAPPGDAVSTGRIGATSTPAPADAPVVDTSVPPRNSAVSSPSVDDDTRAKADAILQGLGL